MKRILFATCLTAIFIAAVTIIWLLFSAGKSVDYDRPQLFYRYIQVQELRNLGVFQQVQILMDHHVADFDLAFSDLDNRCNKKLSIDLFLISVVSLKQGDLDRAVHFADMALRYDNENIEFLLYVIFLYSCVEDRAEWATLATKRILNTTEHGDFPRNAIKLFFDGEQPVYDASKTHRYYLQMYEFIDWMKEYMHLYNWSSTPMAL